MGTLICCGLLYVILLCKCFKKKKPALTGRSCAPAWAGLSARPTVPLSSAPADRLPTLRKRAGQRLSATAGNQRFKIKKAGSHLLSRFRSIIGAEVLDFRVRNGNGYCHLAMATGIHYYAFASRIRAFSRAPPSFMYSLLMEYKSLSSR